MREGSKHQENYRGSPVQRFWRYVEKTDNCWDWIGASHNNGYGTLRINGKNVRVHRFSWELHKGKIPKGNDYHGICVLHKCDNAKCVNPKHLFLGSNDDNVQDMVKKMRNTIGEKNGMVKLTEEKVKDIRRLVKEEGYSLSKITNLFKIAKSTASQIVNYRRWKHI